MNNQQNEQAQVQQTNERVSQQATQTTNSKPKKKPLFQEGTFLYKITYGFTAKVKSGQISFAKVFWIGLIINLIVNVIVGTIFESSTMIVLLIEGFYGAFYMQYLWFARKQVYHPAWFYIGMGIALFPILWFAIGFVKGFIPAFLAARRGY